MGGIRAMDRFMRRLRLDGVGYASTLVGGRRKILTHPAFRLMLNCKHSLKAWSRNTHGSMLLRFGGLESTVTRNQRYASRALLDATLRGVLLCRRKNNCLYGLKCGRWRVTVKEEQVPCIGCKRGRVEEDGAALLPYQYARRDNDEKWILGWA